MAGGQDWARVQTPTRFRVGNCRCLQQHGHHVRQEDDTQQGNSRNTDPALNDRPPNWPGSMYPHGPP